MRDALGLIQLRVNQIVRRLEFHQHRQISFRRRVVPRVRARSGTQDRVCILCPARCPGSRTPADSAPKRAVRSPVRDGKIHNGACGQPLKLCSYVVC